MRTPYRVFAVPFITTLLIGGVSAADDTQTDAEADDRNEPIREWMQDYAEGTGIRLGTEDDAGVADMVEQPVFRYSDVQRRIPDATLWVWTRDSRPVAFQKVEVNAYGKQWTICFASLSEDLLKVEWPPRPVRRNYESTAPGVVFEPIPDADPPANDARLRTLQLKRLTQRFEGRIGVGASDAVIRVIPRPIFEYRDAATELPVGAIFGLTATGTNPDLLLLIEARKNADGELRWEYAYARLTTGRVKLLLDDEIVWETPGVPNNDNVLENWTFYFLPRQLEVASE